MCASGVVSNIIGRAGKRSQEPCSIIIMLISSLLVLHRWVVCLLPWQINFRLSRSPVQLIWQYVIGSEKTTLITHVFHIALSCYNVLVSNPHLPLLADWWRLAEAKKNQDFARGFTGVCVCVRVRAHICDRLWENNPYGACSIVVVS